MQHNNIITHRPLSSSSSSISCTTSSNIVGVGKGTTTKSSNNAKKYCCGLNNINIRTIITLLLLLVAAVLHHNQQHNQHNHSGGIRHNDNGDEDRGATSSSSSSNSSIIAPPQPQPQQQSLQSQPTTTTDDVEAQLEYDDAIYLDIFQSPIVLEQYKLVFFPVKKVACSTWKLLFHKMIGFNSMDAHNYNWEELHNPRKNKLKYLRDYDFQTANTILLDKSENGWTKAIFLRNPHERLLSAYLDKGLRNDANYIKQWCCSSSANANPKNCFPRNKRSFTDFLDLIETTCDEDTHWMPYSHLYDEKVWKYYINFVGHMDADRTQSDARSLLDRLHNNNDDNESLWNKYGAVGWGSNGASALFEPKPTTTKDKNNNANAVVPGQEHGTNSGTKFYQYYTSQEIFDRVTRYYSQDYNNPIMGLSVPQYYNNYKKPQ